jgi:hypothetical protein
VNCVAVSSGFLLSSFCALCLVLLVSLDCLIWIIFSSFCALCLVLLVSLDCLIGFLSSVCVVCRMLPLSLECSFCQHSNQK